MYGLKDYANDDDPIGSCVGFLLCALGTPRIDYGTEQGFAAYDEVIVDETLHGAAGATMRIIYGGAAGDYCSAAYSARACFRIGMSASASFQGVRKS
jgi:hypothetical protein